MKSQFSTGQYPKRDSSAFRSTAAFCHNPSSGLAPVKALAPAQVLDYLARYTHKTAISNQRITGLADGNVSFRVRDPQHPKSGRVASLRATEFVARFLTHVLPPGFKRIRHYGLLASRHKAVKLAACRALLDVPAPVPAVIESVADFMLRVAQVDLSRCPHCADGRMRFVAALAAVRSPAASRFVPHLPTGPPP